MNTDTVLLGSTFIVGGQIKGQPMELFLVYPQGNYIKPADSKPYLVIGVDLIKKKKTLENAYNDKSGVTAKFNKNILNVVNKMNII